MRQIKNWTMDTERDRMSFFYSKVSVGKYALKRSCFQGASCIHNFYISTNLHEYAGFWVIVVLQQVSRVTRKLDFGDLQPGKT